MISRIAGIPVILTILLMLTGTSAPSSALEKPAAPPPDHMMPLKAKASGTPDPGQPPAMPSPERIEQLKQTRAIIQTKYGNIELVFFPEIAPMHVENFVKLSLAKFYDGTAFHRIVPGFMIQGGDPDSKNPARPAVGMGGPGYNIPAEFSDRPHMKGTLSMARRGDPNSAGSQFFICVGPAPWLDGQYSVFGEVVSGMDVVERIAQLPRDTRYKERPLERVEIKVKIIGPSAEARPAKAAKAARGVENTPAPLPAKPKP